MARSTKKNADYLFVEVLQNGVVMSSVKKPLHKKSSLTLTSSYGGDLSVPLYPFSNDIKLFSINKRNVNLRLDLPVDGFITSGGEYINLDSSDRTGREFNLEVGDYASFVYGDLRIIARIGKKHPPTERDTKRDPKTRGGFLKLFYPTKAHSVAGWSSLVIVTIVFAGIIAGMLSRPDDRPKSITQLSENYLLPFIDSSLLTYGPEALQENLDRKNFLYSVVSYYRSFTDMLLTKNNYEKKYMHKSSVERFSEWRSNQVEEIQQRNNEQLRADDLVAQRPGVARITIPSVKGDEAQTKIAWMLGRTNLHVSGLAENQSQRKKYTEVFNHEVFYDDENYKQINKVGKVSKIAKIKAVDILTNIEHMYKQADDYAVKASYKKTVPRYFSESAEDIVRRPLYIPSGIKYASFISRLADKNEQSKIGYIEASSYDPTRKEKIKEPLIGEIDPKLIEKTILAKRFELELCYDATLRSARKTTGKMEWRWRINERGKTGDLELIETTINNKNLVRCIREKIARWNFPRPRRGSVEVTYPFYFKPSKS